MQRQRTHRYGNITPHAWQPGPTDRHLCDLSRRKQDNIVGRVDKQLVRTWHGVRASCREL